MRVLNFGSMNLDYVYQVDHFVGPGETLSASSRAVKLGGKGLNQSVALARAGTRVAHAGCLGMGGAPLKALLDREGVDTSMLEPVSEMQGHTVIQVNREGENCILLYGGSNQCVTGTQISRTLRHCDTGDWLVLQNEVNCLADIVNAAFDKGLTIALNPSPFDDRLADVDYNKLSWLLVNEVEVRQITGCDDPDQAWQRLHRQWPGLSVLITLGSLGSVAYRLREGSVETARQDAFHVMAVDTTAAGDTFTGYFIEGLMRGLPLRESMRRASLAASIAVTRPGAAESIPTLREVEMKY